MNVLRLRADKPRRALPETRGAQDSSRRFSANHLRNLLKRGVTVVVVSGIAVAGFGAFTTSSANSIGTAFADAGPLAIASIPAVQAAAASGTETPTVADLAAERNQELAAAGDQISELQQEAALDARSSAMSGNAAMIAKELERLKNLAKFLWPTAGGVSSPYGPRLHPILRYYRMHDGDDIGGKCGQPVYAAQSGVVIKAEMGYNGGSGNNIRIDHGTINGANIATGYLHLTSYSVTVGQKVNKGDLVGHVGSTGLSTACHLHFSAYRNGRGTDPMEFIGWNPEANRKGNPDAATEG